MKDAAAFSWAAVVPLGPSEQDLQRLDDLLESMVYYEREPRPIYVVNDGASTASVQSRFKRHRVQGQVIPHLRAGIGNAWLGRLTAGLVQAYRQIGYERPGFHVLKLDTDALITRPFSTALAKVVAQDPKAGMIGSVGLTASRIKTTNWFSHRIYRMSKRLARWDHPPYFRINLFGARALTRELILAAYRQGYVADCAPCGGAYLLTNEAIRRLTTLPALQNVNATADETVTEDVFFSIAIYAAGLCVLEQNNPGDVFGVCWKGLPANSLPEVSERSNAIIHSVKDHGRFSEAATREFFRAIRA